MAEEWNGQQEPAITRVETKADTDKKCVQCGGTMDFDPATGGLRCPFCEHTAEIEAGGAAEELDFENAESTGNCNWGAEKKVVLCNSCGAESIYDALDVSNECPYCGSNHVMEEKGKDTLAPGGVCPFKVDARQAGANFHTWIKKKLFCPRIAKQKAKPDSFHGVYLPFWTFDTQTHSTYTASYGIDRTVKESDGKTKTVTDWHRTSGRYAEFIDDQLSPGTARHDRDIMRRIEPFDTANNVAYKPEYVAGFVSERYSIGLQDAWKYAIAQIRSRLEASISSKIKREHHADHVRDLTVNTDFSKTTFKYLMLPIWMSAFSYKGKVFHFMVNGQTGKVGGKCPVSALRVCIAIAIGLFLIYLLYQIM